MWTWGRKGTAHGTSWRVPPWMGCSIQPHAYSSDGPQGTAPKGPGDRPQDAPSTALLPRAASTPASLPSLGTLALLPWSTLVLLPLWRCSQISPPKSLSRLTGYKLFLPFSCCTSRSGHPSAAAASHAAELTLRGWAEGRGWFWERSTYGGSSPTRDKAGNTSAVCTSGGADEHPCTAKRSALRGRAGRHSTGQ